MGYSPHKQCHDSCSCNSTHASGPDRFLRRLLSIPNAKYSAGKIIIRQQAVLELMPMIVSSLRWKALHIRV
jgi:hypothetical protein